MTFDAEVRTSLRAITVEAKTTKAAVDQTNVSLRQTAQAVQQVAVHHRSASVAAQQHAASTGSLATKVGQVGQAAAAAGGASGGLVTRLGGLAAINPMALGVGVAIGFVTSKVTEAIQEVSEFNKLLERTGELGAEIQKGVGAAGRAAVLGADVQSAREQMFDEAGSGTLGLAGIPGDQADAAMEAARIAVSTGKAKSTDEALRRMLKAGAFERGTGAITGGGGAMGVDALAVLGAGLDDMTPEEFARRRQEMAGSPRGQALDLAESRQEMRRGGAARQEAALLEDQAGFSVGARLDAVRAGVAGNPDAAKAMAEASAEIAKMTEELRKLNGGGWHGPIDYFRTMRLESRLSELQAQRTLALQDATAGYR